MNKEPKPLTLQHKIGEEFPTLKLGQINYLIRIFNDHYGNLTCSDCGSKEIINPEKGKEPKVDLYIPDDETIFDYLEQKSNELQMDHLILSEIHKRLINANKLTCFIDGKSLCITRHDFVNLQESQSFFLDLTPDQIECIQLLEKNQLVRTKKE